uniref:Uncharacterized protein n=1 Tax=Brassica oleracea var. oleracea TaxID=109376 RepID=A0A0D3CFA6_BRAOL
MGSTIFDPVTAPLWSRNLRGVSEPVRVREDSGASGLPYVLAYRGDVIRSPASVVFDEYHKVKAWRRRLSYTPPPRLARATLSAGGLSSISSTSAEIMPNRDLLADAHQRLTSEALLLRGQVQDMMACRDLLIQQVRASTRWELMKEWLQKRVDHWNLEEEYRHHLFLSGGFNHRSEDLSQAATPRFVIGSRFSEGPSF